MSRSVDPLCRISKRSFGPIDLFQSVLRSSEKVAPRSATTERDVCLHLQSGATGRNPTLFQGLDKTDQKGTFFRYLARVQSRTAFHRHIPRSRDLCDVSVDLEDGIL